MVATIERGKMQIEQVAVESLIPYARNSRTHSDEQVAQIAASIREFGWTNPILIDGANGIIAGHGRLLAARKLGMAEVPVIQLDGMTETQKKAYIIADNKLALNAGWDDELLKLEIEEVNLEDFEIELIGFSQDELNNLIGAQDVNELDGMPGLPSGDREPFQQMTFTLHDEQAEQVKRAIDVAKDMGDFLGSSNENSNGNALSRVCEIFLTQHGNC